MRPTAFLKMTEHAAKRLKPDNAITVGTHNGHFHADEALAIYMLRNHVPTYAEANLVRTRDSALLESCHTVVDVGGEYDAARNRYDHHQRGFSVTFPGRPTKLSSAGLVYMHFGRGIISRRLACSTENGASSEDDETVGLIWRKIYENFIEALDAHDNGINVYDPEVVETAGLQKRFSDGGFTLGAMVGRLNQNWNDTTPTDKAEAQKLEDQRFEQASKRIGDEFDRDLDYYTKAWLPARVLVTDAFHARLDYDSKGRIMVMKGQSAPWKDHLYNLEDQSSELGQVFYVLYPESPGPDAKWRIQCVPVAKDSFQSRKPLPEAWRGFRDEKLDEIAGVSGSVFVHASGFIGGNKTFDGALAMAKMALDL
jgi:uncharacterized UPF0160 family protein